MNDPVPDSLFKKKIGIAACLLILLYVATGLLILILPEKVVYSNHATSLYRRLILLGPFFQESKIKASPHLFISSYQNGSWSPFIDYGGRNREEYLKHPWRYDKLHSNDFEQYITRQMASPKKLRHYEEMKGSKAFRELNQFIVSQYFKEPTDSISLLYGLNLYLPETNSFRFDTIFAFKYNPLTVAAAKK